MRKTRPATLTSTLLARKGEAEPSLLADGTVPKDVIALQEELVARVAADITRQVREVPTQDVVARPAGLSAEMTAPSREETAAVEPTREAPAAALAPANPEESAKDGDDEVDVAEALGSAPIELPPGSADEPDYDPAEDAAAQQDSQVTLADWTARAQSGDTPFAYERMSDGSESDRSAFVPLALGVTVVAVLATLAIWQFSDHGAVFPQGSPGTVQGDAMPPSAPAAAPESSAALSPPPAPATETPDLSAEPAAPVAQTPAPAPHAAAPAAAAGGYALQLISTVSQETAEGAWGKIAGRVTKAGFSDTHVIERADLGAKGVRYRVMLTGFKSYGAGQKACQSLKTQKLSCLVLRH